MAIDFNVWEKNKIIDKFKQQIEDFDKLKKFNTEISNTNIINDKIKQVQDEFTLSDYDIIKLKKQSKNLNWLNNFLTVTQNTLDTLDFQIDTYVYNDIYDILQMFMCCEKYYEQLWEIISQDNQFQKFSDAETFEDFMKTMDDKLAKLDTKSFKNFKKDNQQVIDDISNVLIEIKKFIEVIRKLFFWQKIGDSFGDVLTILGQLLVLMLLKYVKDYLEEQNSNVSKSNKETMEKGLNVFNNIINMFFVCDDSISLYNVEKINYIKNLLGQINNQINQKNPFINLISLLGNMSDFMSSDDFSKYDFPEKYDYIIGQQNQLLQEKELSPEDYDKTNLNIVSEQQKNLLKEELKTLDTLKSTFCQDCSVLGLYVGEIFDFSFDFIIDLSQYFLDMFKAIMPEIKEQNKVMSFLVSLDLIVQILDQLIEMFSSYANFVNTIKIFSSNDCMRFFANEKDKHSFTIDIAELQSHTTITTSDLVVVTIPEDIVNGHQIQEPPVPKPEDIEDVYEELIPYIKGIDDVSDNLLKLQILQQITCQSIHNITYTDLYDLYIKLKQLSEEQDTTCNIVIDILESNITILHLIDITGINPQPDLLDLILKNIKEIITLRGLINRNTIFTYDPQFDNYLVNLLKGKNTAYYKLYERLLNFKL